MKVRPIIYVEDDENDAFLMKHAFKQCDIQNPMVILSDGREAIDYFAKLECDAKMSGENIPSLVLLDLNLPYKNGHDVLRWIRNHPTFRTLAVIILTSSSHEQDVHEAYSLGANAYLVKTPALEKFVAMVKTIRDFWLQHNHAPTVPPAKPQRLEASLR